MSKRSSLYQTCSGKPKAPICPYCGAKSVLHVNSAKFYHGKDYGPLWACEPCGAWVGCHPGKHVALGRLADKELRTWKSRVHAVLDPLWKIRRHITQDRWSRKQAYKWLAQQLNIEREECHVGMFDLETCKRAVAILEPIHDQLVNRIKGEGWQAVTIKPKQVAA